MAGISGMGQRASGAARRIVERHPELLKGNRIYHRIQRERALRGLEVRPQLALRPELVFRVIDEGVVVVTGFISEHDAASMLAAVEETIDQALGGRLAERTFHSPEPGVLVRIAGVDEVVPAVRPFFEDRVVRSFVDGYLGPGAASFRHELECRYTPTAALQGDLYHFDNWRPICKAFLYLTPVSDENAPFVYARGSHLAGKWRRRHDMAFDTYGMHGPAGCVFPQEMRHLRAEHGWEDLVCTGPAGTLILADLRGLHRGTPLRTGRRVLLNNTFDLMNKELVPSA